MSNLFMLNSLFRQGVPSWSTSLARYSPTIRFGNKACILLSLSRYCCQVSERLLVKLSECLTRRLFVRKLYRVVNRSSHSSLCFARQTCTHVCYVPYSALHACPLLERLQRGVTSSNLNKALFDLVLFLYFSHNMWERKE